MAVTAGARLPDLRVLDARNVLVAPDIFVRIAAELTSGVWTTIRIEVADIDVSSS